MSNILQLQVSPCLWGSILYLRNARTHVLWSISTDMWMGSLFSFTFGTRSLDTISLVHRLEARNVGIETVLFSLLLQVPLRCPG